MSCFSRAAYRPKQSIKSVTSTVTTLEATRIDMMSASMRVAPEWEFVFLLDIASSFP
jgi:hypothetical protein